MKYFKRSNTWKASNVYYNGNTGQAYSYGWWRFVDVINGYVIFNDFGYSTSTKCHQRKVQKLLDQLGIQVDFYVEAPSGLQSFDAMGEAVGEAMDKARALREAAAKPGTHASKEAETNRLLVR